MRVTIVDCKQMVFKIVAFFFFLLGFQFHITAQETVLDEVVVSSPRIELSMDQQSRSVTTITAEEIEESGAATLIDVLSDVAGIELRSRGAQDVQSDIYIRGGGFDQVLLLIDGIKVDNPQTGHHTLNAIIPIEMIARVEILKGAAGRVYGQNAYSGAINIVTKKSPAESLNVVLGGGSFDYQKATLFGTDQRESSNHTALCRNQYLLTDTATTRITITKTTFGSRVGILIKNRLNYWPALTIDVLGQMGFMPILKTFTDQYEATQSSLLGLTTSIQHGNWLRIKPKTILEKRARRVFILIQKRPKYLSVIPAHYE